MTANLPHTARPQPKASLVFDKPTLDRLYRYALSLCHDPNDAYDLLQTALERHLRTQAEAKRHIDNPIAYLFRIIRNAYIDQTRRAKHEPLPLPKDEQLDPTEAAQGPLQPLEALLIDRQEVEELLAQLPAQDRELLFLWAVEGYTVQEIADLQELPRGTLLSRLHRLRKKLQKHAAIERTEASHTQGQEEASQP